MRMMLDLTTPVVLAGGQTLGWLQIVLTAASLPGTAAIAIGLWRLWLWYFGRADTQRQSDESAEARLSERTDQRVEKLLDRLEKLNIEKDAIILHISEDRDRGWALARHWYYCFRDLVPVTRQAMTVATSASRQLLKHGLIVEAELPVFDNAIPAIMPGLEDPA